MAAADVDLPGENEVHAGRGLSFAEDKGSVWSLALGTVGGEPGVFGFCEAIEGGDGAECGYDLGQRRGLGWVGGDEELLRFESGVDLGLDFELRGGGHGLFPRITFDSLVAAGGLPVGAWKMLRLV